MILHSDPLINTHKSAILADHTLTSKDSRNDPSLLDRACLHGIGRFAGICPMYAAIKTADLIGVAALHGVGQAWQDLDVAERFEAGRVGYEILGEGDVGLRNLFTRF